MFLLQIKTSAKRWEHNRYSGPHATLEAAEVAARSLDEDGMFSCNVRIVDASGNVVKKGDNS